VPNDAKQLYLPLLFLSLLFPASAQSSYTEKQVIRYAKALNVDMLDPALPAQHLEDWLRSGTPRLDRVSWQMSPNCDQKPVDKGVRYSDLPLCVKIYYQRGNVSGWGMITVGTIGKGPSGAPHVQEIWVEPRKTEDPGAGDTYISDMSFTLSDLPLLLDEVSYTVERKEVIRYAKALDVGTLDPALSSERLDDWLRSGPARSDKLAWGVRLDCDARRKPTLPTNESPLCVTAVFGRGDIRGWATIVIGTLGKGPSGSPRLQSVSVQPMSKDERARQTSDKLSDLPRLLDEVSSSTNHR